jgi:hypothetical protein
VTLNVHTQIKMAGYTIRIHEYSVIPSVSQARTRNKGKGRGGAIPPIVPRLNTGSPLMTLLVIKTDARFTAKAVL